MDHEHISILLIEDNPGDARLIREALRDVIGDFVIEHADRLSTGIDRLAEGAFDVVLLDLSLPDAHGLETFYRVASEAGDAAVVVLTGLDDEATAVAAVNAGAQDYLPKSHIEAEVLGRSIRYSVERQRLVTELRKLDAAKTRFIADAAHELRTPLTTLAGFAEMIEKHGKGMSPEQLETALNAIGRQSHHVSTLVNNLLDLSQVDAGKLTMNITDVNVAHAAKRAIDISGAPPERDVRADVGDELCVRADPHRLDQILVNLLTNAYRYGGNSVRITSNVARGEIVVTVSDDGPGVPSDMAEKLFDPFARGKNTGAIKGSGLGLAIVRKLVLAMGGEVWHEPVAPHGAAFRLRLPAA